MTRSRQRRDRTMKLEVDFENLPLRPTADSWPVGLVPVAALSWFQCHNQRAPLPLLTASERRSENSWHGLSMQTRPRANLNAPPDELVYMTRAQVQDRLLARAKIWCQCPLLAPNRHHRRLAECPLLGADPTFAPRRRRPLLTQGRIRGLEAGNPRTRLRRRSVSTIVAVRTCNGTCSSVRLA